MRAVTGNTWGENRKTMGLAYIRCRRQSSMLAVMTTLLSEEDAMAFHSACTVLLGTHAQ